jgi:hypothetical protein
MQLNVSPSAPCPNASHSPSTTSSNRTQGQQKGRHSPYGEKALPRCTLCTVTATSPACLLLSSGAHQRTTSDAGHQLSHEGRHLCDYVLTSCGAEVQMAKLLSNKLCVVTGEASPQALHVDPPSKPTAPLLQVVAARLRLLKHRQWCSRCCVPSGTATTHVALAGGGRGIGAAIALEFAKVRHHQLAQADLRPPAMMAMWICNQTRLTSNATYVCAVQEGATLALVARSEDQLKEVHTTPQYLRTSPPQTGMNDFIAPCLAVHCTRPIRPHAT